MEYSDLKITYVEHLSVINHLTKSIEDILIRKSRLFSIPLLLIDVPLFFAVLIANIERSIYNNVIEFFVAHIKIDIYPIMRRFKEILPEKWLADYEEREEDLPEETWAGRIFQFFRSLWQFLWALVIFALFLPIWPLIWLYNLFASIFVVGLLYYFLIFMTFPAWWGALLYFLIFGTVTFLISSITVPAILRIFIYVKYLFSLERKSWRAVNGEAKAAFFDFYLRVQKNRIESLTKIEPRYAKKHKAKGGVYYLFLKIIHGVKDYILNLRKRSVTDLFEKMEKKIVAVQSELDEEKKGYETHVSLMQRSEIIKTSIALGFTFLLSGWLARIGLEGHNLLAGVFLSFLDHKTATTIWWNYEGSRVGYYEYLGSLYNFIPGFVKLIFSGIDHFWGYFFRLYYYLLPLYGTFLVNYYAFFGAWFAKLF